ncbi:hypothetical protein L486_00104 [Kwoniella mangroviensis CBS 10435]|uniref:Uncharacterized protein n=1 Tax=Kwoniella mangroviensis CBS 10435 TaxID=1331196 RepID=A0A1B9IY75_9TREE|nr:hypothetical protein L486_00104 [Kwoniella mangroviensis CBS 10435]
MNIPSKADISSESRTSVASADNYSRLDTTSSSANEGLGPEKVSARVQRGRDRYDTSNVNSSYGGDQRVTKGRSGYEMTDPAPPPSDGGSQNGISGNAPDPVDHWATFTSAARSHLKSWRIGRLTRV